MLGRTEARPRVGISGHERFVTLFMHSTDAAPEWELCALDVRTWAARVASLRNFLRCDVWYTIGTGKATVWFELLAFLLRKPRVVHWVGSDILTLGRFPPYRLLWRMRKSRTAHIAEIDWTAHELEVYGLHPDTIALPLHLGSGAPPPLPSVFTILCYIPAGFEEFYGVKWYEALIASCRDLPVAFIIAGGGRIHTEPGARVEHVTWAETPDELDCVYTRSTVMLRMTPHDGLSCMVLEALSRGRHVVWNQRFPFAYFAETFEDVRAHVASLLSRFQAGELQSQCEAAARIQETYQRMRSVNALSAHWRSVLFPAGRDKT